MTEPNLQGRIPSADQLAMIQATAEHWRKLSSEAPVQGIARVEDAAKQLITLNGTLQGIYLAAFALGSLSQRVPIWLIPLFFVPVLLWLSSLFYATRVFVPQARTDADLDDVRVDAWLDVRKVYTSTLHEKLHFLHRAHQLLVWSFVAVVVPLVVLTFVLSTPTPQPTQIIIVTPTPTP